MRDAEKGSREFRRADIIPMAKKKFTPRGPWRVADVEKPHISKEDPRKLRIRAEELKLKAARLANEADELFAKAEHIEAARKEQGTD